MNVFKSNVFASNVFESNVFAPDADSGVTGTLAVTEGADTMSASGTLTITGTIAATNGGDSAALAGAETFSGALAVQNANDSASLAGAETFSGTLAASAAGDAADFDGTVTANITGTMAVTNGDDTMVAVGTGGSVTPPVGGAGGSSRRERKQKIEKVVQRRPKDVTGVMTANEGSDGVKAVGEVDNTRRAQMAAFSAGDSAHAIGRVKEPRAVMAARRASRPAYEPAVDAYEIRRSQLRFGRDLVLESQTDIDSREKAELEEIAAL